MLVTNFYAVFTSDIYRTKCSIELELIALLGKVLNSLRQMYMLLLPFHWHYLNNWYKTILSLQALLRFERYRQMKISPLLYSCLKVKSLSLFFFFKTKSKVFVATMFQLWIIKRSLLSVLILTSRAPRDLISFGKWAVPFKYTENRLYLWQCLPRSDLIREVLSGRRAGDKDVSF